jgi:hypothetical protein
VSSRAESEGQAQLRRQTCANLPLTLLGLKDSSRAVNLDWAVWREEVLYASAMVLLSGLTSLTSGGHRPSAPPTGYRAPCRRVFGMAGRPRALREWLDGLQQPLRSMRRDLRQG